MFKKALIKYGIPLVITGGMGSMMLFAVLGAGNQDSLNAGGTIESGCTVSSGSYNKDKVDDVLSRAGAFSGKRTAFESVAKKYNIDPVLMMAIAIHETGWGTSQAVLVHNNPSGQMGANGLIHFSTLEEGLDMTGQTLNNLWNERQLNTIEKLGSAYCPVGAANDPHGLNKNWVPAIKGFIEQLGGMNGVCDTEAAETNANLAAGANGFAVPVKNYQITSPYGQRGGEFHRGLDMGASEGEPIYASKAGVIITSEYHYSWGYHIVIEHENGMMTLYAHQSKLIGRAGQKVKQGTLIGLVGNTGNSFGSHLHLEMGTNTSLSQDTLIDPYPVLFGKKK